jgi:hypothetical protein
MGLPTLIHALQENMPVDRLSQKWLYIGLHVFLRQRCKNNDALELNDMLLEFTS